MNMTMNHPMNSIKGCYALIITNKWFYFSIAATIFAYIQLNQGVNDYAHDYVVFGPAIASLHDYLLHFYYLTFRYGIVLTELSIFCWAWWETYETDPKFPDVLPAGIAWRSIWLQFTDDENIMITAGQYRRGASYADMGMADRRGKTLKPNLQWQFLLLLAKKQGELSFKDPEADDKWVKQKELLSGKLKTYFRMDSDPFFRYTTKYKIRLTLIPKREEAAVGHESGQKPQVEAFVSQEVKDNFEAQADQVNDTDQSNEAWHESQGRTPRIRVWHSDE